MKSVIARMNFANRTTAGAFTSIALLFLALIASPFRALGDSIVWEGYMPYSENGWMIPTAYQVEDEVWLVHYVGFLPPTTWMVSYPLELDVDSILVTRLVNQYELDSTPGYVMLIYSVLADYDGVYDPSIGDRWIDHPAFGWCWVGFLPWVWISTEDTWAYVQSAGTMAFDLPDNTWWIWTAEHDWFWTAQRIYPWKWLLSGDWTND